MKIDAVHVHSRTLKRADPEWRTASYRADSVGGVFVLVEAGGEVGVGASASHPRRITTEALTGQLATEVAPALTGQSLSRARRILVELSGRIAARASIAVDLALHDLIGKLAGLPAEVIWGGPLRERIDLVRMVGIKEPNEIVPAVRPLHDAGVRAFKVKIGDGVERDLDRVRNLRSAYDNVTLMVDANGAYDRESAARLCDGLGELDVHCVEQPLPYDDLAGMAELRSRSPVPLMADQMVECAADAVRVGQARAADLVSLKLTKMGSVHECVRVAHVCAAMQLRVHLGGAASPGVVDSALARLALAMPDIDPFAEVGESNALIDDQAGGAVYSGAFVTSDGRPGLGGPPLRFEP